MTDHDLGLAGLIGTVLPLLISLIIQSDWREQAKAVVSFIICAVAAVAMSFFTDRIQWNEPGFDWVAWFGAIYGATMILFARLYQKTGITPRLTGATDLK